MAKKNKKISWHELTNEELESRYIDFKKELRELRFKIVTSSVSNVKQISKLKKDIARILTVKQLRELAK